MKQSLLSLTFYILLITTTFGQGYTREGIEKLSAQIDSNKTLKKTEFEANEVYNVTYDGGGTIELYFDGPDLKKIKQTIGVSYGVLTTIIYFNNGDPIKIIDKEENFKFIEKDSKWDYSTIEEVYQLTLYPVNHESKDIQPIEKGKRRLSDQKDDLKDFEELIELGKRLKEK
jgi:hypothetical protein